jgi:hypothetical protein
LPERGWALPSGLPAMVAHRAMMLLDRKFLVIVLSFVDDFYPADGKLLHLLQKFLAADKQTGINGTVNISWRDSFNL